MDTRIPDLRAGGRIGFLADTHCHGTPDKLPGAVLDALRGVDLVVHLGDMGEGWVLDRLATVAPAVATRGGDDPAHDERIAATRLFEVGGLVVGALFDLGTQGVTLDGDRLRFPADGARNVARRAFDRDVDVLVFGATHQELIAWRDGMLFVNPGSATLPGRPRPSGLGTVALVDVRDSTAMVSMVNL